MITEKKFQEYIGQIGEQYEKLKLAIHASDATLTDKMDLLDDLVALRNLSCIALSESHKTHNFHQN